MDNKVKKLLMMEEPDLIPSEVIKVADKVEEIEKKLEEPLTLEIKSDEKKLNLIQGIFEKIKTIKGEKGDSIKGDDGYTPIKGEDYFTIEEQEEFLQKVTPIKGTHYRDGRDGYTPVKGVDYKDGENGSPDTAEQIVWKINQLDKVLEAKTIKGMFSIEDVIKELKNPKSKFRLERKDINGLPLDNIYDKNGRLNDQRWHGGWSSDQTDPLYLKLDQTVPQVTTGTFKFPTVLARYASGFASGGVESLVIGNNENGIVGIANGENGAGGYFIGQASAGVSYGVRSEVTGTGAEDYGLYTTVNGALINYGLYTSAAGGVTNYGIYSALGKNYFNDEIICNSTGTFLGANGNVVIPTIFTDSKELTGFVDPSGITSTYDSTAKTITLTHAGGIDYYWRGVKKTLASPWTSSDHPVGNNKYYLSSTDGTNFTWSTSMWNFYDLQVAFVNYGATNKYGRRETHGLMQWQAHEEAHDVIGTYLDTGGDLSGYNLTSTTPADRRPIVSSTTVQDEDLSSTIATLTSSLYTKHYVSGAGATSTYVVDTADIVPLNGTNPYWNQYTGGAWQQTLMSNNSYMAVWLIALPSTADAGSQSYRYVWVQGQTNGTLAQIQSLTPTSLNLGQMASENPEFVFIDKIIIRYTAGDWTIEQVDKLTGSRFSQVSLIGGVSGYVSKVGDTMTGDLRGTDFIKTRSQTATWTGGLLTKIVKTGGRTIDYTYASGVLQSYTDGINTWTITYNGDGTYNSTTVT